MEIMPENKADERLVHWHTDALDEFNREETINLLGDKGAYLNRLAVAGIATQPAFTLTTVGTRCLRTEPQNEALQQGLATMISRLETETGCKFDDPEAPLFVSVRLAAQVRLRGLLGAVMPIGLSDWTLDSVSRLCGPLFAVNSYCKLIQSYGSQVLGIHSNEFEDIIRDVQQERGHTILNDMTDDDWGAVIREFRKTIESKSSAPFPQSGREQLKEAIQAGVLSWHSSEADRFRRFNNIPKDCEVAVTVQAFTFSGAHETDGTGRADTRDPTTGVQGPLGVFLTQGNAGELGRLLKPLGSENEDPRDRLKNLSDCPAQLKSLTAISRRLEQTFGEAITFDYIQSGTDFVLTGARPTNLSAEARIRAATDFVDEGLFTPEQAILSVPPIFLERLLHPSFDPNETRKVVTRGLPASPGAASGRVAFSATEAERLAAGGADVILVRNETGPEDVSAQQMVRGVLTTRGGMSSHAALIARGIGRPCVTGAYEINVDEGAKTFKVGSQTVSAGDYISIDGESGEVMLEQMTSLQPRLSKELTRLLNWTTQVRRLKVRANADTVQDFKAAIGFGADGVGLCRTEQMLMDVRRLTTVRKMILAATETDRRAAINELIPIQREDFVALFRTISGRPLTVRLLDPPLHEFLPRTDEDTYDLAERIGLNPQEVADRISALRETNPMLGNRGCRLGICHSDIYEAQVRAIFEAASQVCGDEDVSLDIEIMIPLVCTQREMALLHDLVVETADETLSTKNSLAGKMTYRIGAMLELPRACLRAGDIAKVAEFFSFGTNDLTQTTLGISRDDASHFLSVYRRKQVFDSDPFVEIDRLGVGELIKQAIHEGRNARKTILLGVCGEHGGNPESINFFEEIGLDYVSCSPYRVPVARLAAAQATLRQSGKDTPVW